MTKVVINRCFGGFGLSELAMSEIAKRKQWTVLEGRYTRWKNNDDVEVSYYDIAREDPDLVATVEMMGENAWGNHAELMVVDIPNDVEWTIEEYDGREWIAEKHRVWP